MSAADVVCILLAAGVVVLLWLAVDAWVDGEKDEGGPWWTGWR